METTSSMTPIILSRLDEYKKGLEVNDYQKCAKVCSEDIRSFAPHKPMIEGRKGLVAYLEDLKKTRGQPNIEIIKVEDVEVMASTWALCHAHFYQWEGKTRSPMSRILIVWKKVADQWYIYRSVFNEETPRK